MSMMSKPMDSLASGLKSQNILKNNHRVTSFSGVLMEFGHIIRRSIDGITFRQIWSFNCSILTYWVSHYHVKLRKQQLFSISILLQQSLTMDSLIPLQQKHQLQEETTEPWISANFLTLLLRWRATLADTLEETLCHHAHLAFAITCMKKSSALPKNN